MDRPESDEESKSRQPLFLEKISDVNAERDLDEVVPEFMRRAFYRSTEDELQAIEAPILKKRMSLPGTPQPPSPPRQLAPLRQASAENMAPAPLNKVEPGPPAPLAPLRSFETEPESVPLATAPPVAPIAPTPAAVKETAENPGSINRSLVMCLFFILGLFWWREQSRPELLPQAVLPFPESVKVLPSSTPKLSPTPLASATPREDQINVGPNQGSPQPTPPAQAAVHEDGSPEQDQSLFPGSEEPAEQEKNLSNDRAAMLEKSRALEATGQESNPTSRVEEDGSLFPTEEPQERPARPEPLPRPAPAPVAEPAPKAPVVSSFPEVPEPVPAPVSAPAATVPSIPETYQIDEPSL